MTNWNRESGQKHRELIFVDIIAIFISEKFLYSFALLKKLQLTIDVSCNESTELNGT